MLAVEGSLPFFKVESFPIDIDEQLVAPSLLIVVFCSSSIRS
jgi:hypothetical protein